MFNQKIEAINIMMDKIEKKDNNYMENQKWKDLYNYREKCYRKCINEELVYAKSKFKDTGEKRFYDKIKQCEDYLKQEYNYV